MKNQPEICYEDFSRGEETITGGLPFINLEEEQNMPSILFLYESKKIEEEDLEREIILHSYANMMQLKEKLSEDLYDQIRKSLGLMPLKEAVKLGEKINDKISDNIKDKSEV